MDENKNNRVKDCSGQSERAFIINGITVKAENVSNITQNQFLKPVNKHRD